jgi:hypothetical protein
VVVTLIFTHVPMWGNCIIHLQICSFTQGLLCFQPQDFAQDHTCQSRRSVSKIILSPNLCMCGHTETALAHTHNPILTRSAVKSHKKLCNYTTSFNPFAAAAIEPSLYLSSSKTLSYPSSLLFSQSRKILILKPWQASMSCLHGKAICSFPPTCKPADSLALSR